VSETAPLLLEQRLVALESKLAQFAADSAEQLAKVQSERDEYRKLVLHLREENERLKRGLLGQKAERLPQNDAQLSLAILAMAMGAPSAGQGEAAVEKQLVPQHTRRKPKRKPPAEDLPRVQFEILPPEVEREGLDAFELIGTETRSVLERRPSSNVVVEIVYKKFVRKAEKRGTQPQQSAQDAAETVPAALEITATAAGAISATAEVASQGGQETKVLVADTVELPIPRGSAGPGMLADSIIRRWADHQPLHRLEGIYGREGLPLARSTLCTWHMELADLCRPLVDVMFADALTAPYVCVDATGVLVLAKERCRTGHFWVLVAPERHVLYRYSRDHDGKAVDKLLPGYTGFLVADAHSVYDHLFVSGAVVEVACWAHARRYGFKALASDPERAKVMLTHIGALFAIERTIVDAQPNKRKAVRQDKSKTIVEAFFRWCEEQKDRVLDESPISQAIGYALNQRKALERFLDDGRLPLHNNISELNLRRQVTGRRNWIFLGSDDGGETNTVFVSLLASCRLHQIEPLSYMRDLLCLLPRWPKHRLLELAPVNWQKTLEDPKTQGALDANIFRRAVLGLGPRSVDHA
jgi:transposase